MLSNSRRIYVLDKGIMNNWESFKDLEQDVLNLYNDEFGISCCEKKDIKEDVVRTVERLGFEWDSLSEKGYMRFHPYAVSMMEAMKQYIYNFAEEFCNQANVSFQRIDGGELYSMNNSNINRHVAMATTSMMYGENMLKVEGGENDQILRFSGCSNKLGMLQSQKLKKDDFPIGIFEISKSYRYERLERLNCCERVRCFHLPELHIITSQMDDSLKIMLAAHERIVQHIKELGYDFILMCSATEEFIYNNIEYIQKLAQSSNHQVLFTVTSNEEVCENGIQFDVEYKAITSYGGFIEIATLQVDAGDSDFAYGISCNEKPVSTIHAVFFASIERAIYAIVDRCINNKMNSMPYSLPAWISPVQCRIILKDGESIHNTLKLRSELADRFVRCEIDDREIAYDEKINDAMLNLWPIVIVVSNNEEYEIYDSYSQEYQYCKKEQIGEYIVSRLSLKRIMTPLCATYRMSNRTL